MNPHVEIQQPEEVRDNRACIYLSQAPLVSKSRPRLHGTSARACQQTFWYAATLLFHARWRVTRPITYNVLSCLYTNSEVPGLTLPKEKSSTTNLLTNYGHLGCLGLPLKATDSVTNWSNTDDFLFTFSGELFQCLKSHFSCYTPIWRLG